MAKTRLNCIQFKFWSKMEKVINMAKQIRTENLKSDSGSKFLEYAWSDHHFAKSLQKIAVFDEKLYC